MTDQHFIDGILKGGSVMHKTVEWFYHENFNFIYKMAGSHRLMKDEVLDAYSDAMTAFIENIRNKRFRGESKCRTYFIRIFNNKCIDIIRKKATNRLDKNTIFLDDMGTEPTQIVMDEEQSILLTDSLDQLTDICKELLLDWSDGYPMEEIAIRNGLKNAHTARSKRYNCFQQLMTILQKNRMQPLIR